MLVVLVTELGGTPPPPHRRGLTALLLVSRYTRAILNYLTTAVAPKLTGANQNIDTVRGRPSHSLSRCSLPVGRCPVVVV